MEARLEELETGPLAHLTYQEMRDYHPGDEDPHEPYAYGESARPTGRAGTPGIVGAARSR
jgi:hypothetical protein